MQPLVFSPIYQQRVWGGRQLESRYGRALPDEAPYGESWEISDREEAQSTVIRGKYQDRTLNDLWENERKTLFGDFHSERFPLLIKILDAQSDLSIQVHPPTAIATSLGGEPKTEIWYIAHAEPSAKIYVGLKKETTRRAFENALQNGDPSKLVHTIYPKTGESIHIPSGRLHAIGAGLVIYEIQQNSDTTFRVFDWNRKGLDGKPRQLHIEESLQCIDFEDIEPSMDSPQGNTLANCPYYKVDKWHYKAEDFVNNPSETECSIVAVITGKLIDSNGNIYTAGSFMILPIGATPLNALENTTILQTTIGRGR